MMCPYLMWHPLAAFYASQEWLAQNVTVVDQHGDWMCRWCRQFQSLRITHLRSSSALHVDPVDTYALVNYAEDAGRAHELQPLRSICKSRYSCIDMLSGFIP